MKKIELTQEEVKKFYSQVAKEEACYNALSSETIGSLMDMTDEKMEKYMKASQDNLASVLEESSMFLLELRKKYNLRKITVENDYLIVDDDDVIDPNNLKAPTCENCR